MAVKPMVAASALVVGLGMSWASPAVAADPQTGTPAEAQPRSAQPDSSRRVCRNLALSGTRLTRRSCRTQTAWEEDAEAARRAHADGSSSQDSQNMDPAARPLGAPRR
ncbi:MAG TPA: hypothetical protein VEX35_11860 [Allosphingosinicella sp.]|nr:hypothetical protein [Allosphingosinicella sp.]